MRQMFFVLLLAAAPLVASPARAKQLDRAGVIKLLKRVQNAQHAAGDRSLVFTLFSKRRNRQNLTTEGVAYQRTESQRLVILFTKPKSERGKGYIRFNKNLWFYDARIGKWQRRTERARIAGSDANREDFDFPRFAEEYNGRHLRDVSLGRFHTHLIELHKKRDAAVAYAKVLIWIDSKSGMILKRQDFGASGKLIRTLFKPTWKKYYSPSNKANVWWPKTVRIYDELIKGNYTVVKFTRSSFKKLPSNLFTKAWLESKSR